MFSWYPEYEELLAQTQLVLFMLGMGANLTLGDFGQVLKRPRSFISAAIGQILLSPFVAVGINYLFALDAGAALGLILVAAMPGGALAKLFTYFGKGNVPLAITLAGFTTLTTIVFVPLWLNLLVGDYVPEGFAVPVDAVMFDVVCFLLFPLLVGMALGRYLPAHRQRFARICLRLGLVVVVVIVAGSLGSGRINPAAYGWTLPLAVILFCVLCQQLNQVPFYVMGWPRADRLAAAVEMTMRNTNLALLLYAEFFAHDEELGGGVLFVILLYAGVALIAGVPLTLRHRRNARREARAAADATSPDREGGGSGRPAASPP